MLSESTSPQLLGAAAEAFRAASKLSPMDSASVLVDGGQTLLRNKSIAAKDLAVALLEDAANIDQKNPAKQAATLSSIGSTYARLTPPQKERALDHYQRAIILARTEKDKEAEVTAILAKAQGVGLLNAEDEQLEVNQLYDQAVAVYNNDPPRKVDTLVRIGRAIVLSRDEKTMAQAEQFFTAALNLAQAQPDKKITASAYMGIGMAYRLSKRATAAEHFQHALAIYEAEADLYGQAMALYRLSSLARSGAQQFRDRSLALFATLMSTLHLSNTLELAEAYFAIGSLHRQNKKYEEALYNFQQAQVIYLSLTTLPDQSSKLRNVQNLIRTTERLLDR